jgi:rare lipoprotein A
MNYKTFTALTAILTAVSLPAVAVATPSVNISDRASTISSTQSPMQIAQVGQASFYGLEGGRVTANGERYNPNSLTAAHRSLPFGTNVRVTNVRNGRSVVVRINNRGPFIGGRIIDLSVAAARVIGLTSSGVGAVRLDILGR